MASAMRQLIQRLRQFVEERDWEQFHSPKNLTMALSVEVAEIVEHFQWLNEQQSREHENSPILSPARPSNWAPFVVLFLGLSRDSLPQDRGPLFSEITDIAQLNFVHDLGADGSFFMPEIMGSGGAFFDYDNDGDLDIYLIQAGSHSQGATLPNRLYRHEADGTFADVTAVSGLGDTGYGMGVAVGDIDNDGWRDLYITNYGRDALYRNEGGERFTNITSRAGISGEQWSASACFCDYDQDGYLDLYVTHYLNYDPKKECIKSDGSRGYCAPTVFPGARDVLYHNEGNGTFTDVSLQAGIQAAAEPGLGIICADFNEDVLPDFYVANDEGANLLWINQGKGIFKDAAFLSGVGLNALGRTEVGMGLAVGDVEGDGDLDLFVTHITNRNQHSVPQRRPYES